MHFSGITISLLVAAASALEATGDKVHVRIDRAVNCERKTRKGDKISVHYRGSLQDGGKEFDASYNRGDPLSFVVGTGSVIKGWDENLLDMCINEKRTLTIPPEFGYGAVDMGPIPAHSTLIFETELISIEGVDPPKPIEDKSNYNALSKGFQGVKEIIQNKFTGFLTVLDKFFPLKDEDEQEHNEL